VALLLMLSCHVAQAQVLSAPWVEDTQKEIEQLRMTPVRIVVMDRDGKPVARAKVRVRMVRHQFPFGLALDPLAFDEDDEERARMAVNRRQPPDLTQPLWRAISAVTLERATAWAATEPERGEFDFALPARMLHWAREHGLGVRWGPIVGDDKRSMPVWTWDLDPGAWGRAAETYSREMLNRFGGKVTQIDTPGGAPEVDLLTEMRGLAWRRRWHERMIVAEPAAMFSLRFEDAMVGPGFQAASQRVWQMREAFVPVDAVALGGKFTGVVVRPRMVRRMERLRALKRPIVITDAAVQGASEAAAAQNMETVLRSLFAEPTIEGIFFAGPMRDPASPDVAALLDVRGQPTKVGELIDRLIWDTWRTDTTVTTDELGNVRLDVYAGTYEISAEMTDGTTAQTDVYLPRSNTERLVALQPLSLPE